MAAIRPMAAPATIQPYHFMPGPASAFGSGWVYQAHSPING